MTKQHATDPRAIREARHRHKREAHAEKLAARREHHHGPALVGLCFRCLTWLHEGEQFTTLSAGQEPMLLCTPCDEATA